jgi:hypothetical protein
MQQQAFVNQRSYPVQHVQREPSIGISNGFGGFQRASAYEYPQAFK